jgi:peptidyl-prolyl cis-trans isomerase D
MGLMNTIRKNPIILIVSIGLAMAGFILMDMLSSGGPGGGNDTSLGKVNGERIDMQLFMETENVLYANSGQDVYVRRESLWNYFVDKIIVHEMADDLGLGVGKAELQELQFGQNLSPVIRRNFQNPETMQVDRDQINNVKQAIESNELPPELRRFWAEQEREVIKDRLQVKMANMVLKGMYTPTWQVEMLSKDGAEKREIAYVRIPFDAVPDNEVSFTDEDLKTYLKENESRFKKDVETRSLSYVSIKVMPTAGDSAAIYQQLADLVTPFMETENDTLFVENNFGLMDGTYFPREAFQSEEADTLFKIPAGTVYGPYLEGNQYMLVKVLDSKVIPDSVRSRHILIQAKDPASIAQADATIDSLKNLIETGVASFDSLAANFGQDATRTSGGDLGFTAQGQMVKPFNDLIFYNAEPNKLYKVTTEFGVHLVEVTDRQFIENKVGINIGMIAEAILPSEDTQKRAYQRALEMVSKYRTLDELKAAVSSSEDLVLERTSLVKDTDFNLGVLGKGNTAREIIQWAFTQKSIGAVSPEVYAFDNPQMNYTDRYVVVSLSTILEAGVPSVEDIRLQLESEVRKKLKGEKLTAEIAGSNVDAVAQKYGITVDNATEITFNNSFIPGLGNEPKLIGAVYNLPANATSKPVVGNNGVYLAQVLTVEQNVSLPTPAQLRTQRRSQRAIRTSTAFAEAMRKHADVEDNRANFF